MSRVLVLGILIFAVCSAVQGRWASVQKMSTAACGQIEKDTQTQSRYLLINVCETKMTISVALSGRGKEYTLEKYTAVDLVDLQKDDADFTAPKFQILHEKSHRLGGSVTEYITPTVTYYRQASLYDPKVPTEIHETAVRVYFPFRARSKDVIKAQVESFSRQDKSSVQYWNRMIKVSYVCLDPPATGPVFTFTIVRKAYLDLSLKQDTYDIRCREGSKAQLITGAWAEHFVESTQQSCIHLIEHKLDKKKNPWYLLNTCAGTHSVEVRNAEDQLAVQKPILVPAGHLIRIADDTAAKFDKLALWRHIPITGEEPRVYRYIGAYDAPCYVQQGDIIRARANKCFTEDKTAAKYVCIPEKIEFAPVPAQVMTTNIPLGRRDVARMESCGAGKALALDGQWLYQANHLKSPISYLKAKPGKIGK